MAVSDKIKNKPAAERARLKGLEIAKIGAVKRHKRKNDYFDGEIEIRDIVEIDDGVSYYARPWDKKGNPIGFGDGTVEWEHFNVHNPRILVPDPNGDITQTWTDKEGKQQSRVLKEDLQEALLQDLAHTLTIVGRDGSKIIAGKEGHTTDTFYPSYDGTLTTALKSSWANWHDAASADSTQPTNATLYLYVQQSGAYNNGDRFYAHFDTSSLSGVTIVSATFSAYVQSGGYLNGDNDGQDLMGLIQTSFSDPTSPVVGDWGNFGTTLGATAIDWSSLSKNAYNDFALNATGLTWISKTATLTQLGLREGHDYLNSSIAASSNNQVQISASETAGTTQDPKLVVVHSAATAEANAIAFGANF